MTIFVLITINGIFGVKTTDKMNILVTGASGLLGSNLCMYLSKDHNVTAFYNTNQIKIPNVEVIKMDITTESIFQRKDFFKNLDLIIHCAAIANMDLCEKEPEFAFKTHVTGTLNLVKQCSPRLWAFLGSIISVPVLKTCVK